MVSINYSAREVCCKIVYYGPGLSGKTTNLQYIHSKVPQDTRGKLISLATEADRTLYFDFLPINIGTINDFQAKFQLYTVPGQVYYNATRKLVLRGVDGVVFVADSQPDKMDENLESLANLEENLVEYGYNPDELPMVIQYNKCDLPGVMSSDELNAKLNQKGRPFFHGSATLGNGVFDTLKLIIKLVLEKAKATGKGEGAARPAAQAAPAPPAPSVEKPYPETAPAAATAPAPEQQAAAVAEAPVVDQPAEVAVESQPLAATAEPESQPLAATAEPESQPAATTAEPEPREELSREAAYRPYPGSEKASTERKAPALGRSQAEELPAEALGRNIGAGTSDRQEQQSTVASTPQMAPSLRRRGENKKRGFFKRLFGIK
ncbi:MAG: GTPase [bacterium]|nr:GTPase [bacterium]